MRSIDVAAAYWNDWYFGLGWSLWFGGVFLVFWSMGNWGERYRAHHKAGMPPGQEACDILSARFARGEITRDEFAQMKAEIARD